LVSQPPGTIAELSLAYCSGALAQLCTTPISVVTARQQTTALKERKGLFGTANEVVSGENGVTGLWKGFRASLILCINPAITYGATERLRMILFRGKPSLTAWESFCKSTHDPLKMA
jgi:Mitochondrial carrier protein